MAKMSTQQRLNILAASTIGLCELFEQLLTVQGLLIPEVKLRLDNTQEICYQVCPEAHKRDFALCYSAVQGQTINLAGEPSEVSATVEGGG